MTLPYINLLLKQLARGDSMVEKSFGRHIHWGYWPDPAVAQPSSVEDFGAAAERLSLELISLAGITPGMRVLDAGCGFGGTIACLQERIPGLDLVGLNIDPRQLQRAASLVTSSDGNAISFVGGNACALPFADNSFDRVMAVECIFHFPSRLDFLREVKRVLRPGGAMVLSDFVPHPLFAPLGKLSRLEAFSSINLFGRSDVSCTDSGYRRIAAEAGLTITTLRDVTRNILPTYAFLQHLGAAPNMAGVPGRRHAAPFIKLLDFYGRRGWLCYKFLRFDKH